MKEVVQETVGVDVFVMGWDTPIRAKRLMTTGDIATVKAKCVNIVANGKLLTKSAAPLKSTPDLEETE